MSPVLVAVDGGNSKTDIALVASNGTVLGTARTAAGSYHAVGMETMIGNIEGGIREASVAGGLDPDDLDPALGVYCLAGADLPVDDRRLQQVLGAAGIAQKTIVLNDAFAGLRAGSTTGWGISLVCGAGMNCAGVGPTGHTVRFPALGALSGDEGGGGDLAVRALGAAVRGQDGRARRTSLETLIPEHFSLRRPIDVVAAVHVGDVPHNALLGLAPVVFAAAQEDDEVARELVNWLADELVLMGSIWKTSDSGFHDRVRDGLLAVGPQAVLRPLAAPPVLGAALLGSDRLGLGPRAESRLRAQLTELHATKL